MDFDGGFSCIHPLPKRIDRFFAGFELDFIGILLDGRFCFADFIVRHMARSAIRRAFGFNRLQLADDAVRLRKRVRCFAGNGDDDAARIAARVLLFDRHNPRSLPKTVRIIRDNHLLPRREAIPVIAGQRVEVNCRCCQADLRSLPFRQHLLSARQQFFWRGECIVLVDGGTDAVL